MSKPDLLEPPPVALMQELWRVGAWIADRRHRSLQPREPWPYAASPAGWPFAEHLHLSSSCGNGPPGLGIPSDLVRKAQEIGLLVEDDQRGHRGGRWQLTAMHGVFAVRDRPTDGQRSVFLGDDGTRLLETVLAARPRGVVLDVGCGAGLATSGAALSADAVHGFDIVPECVEAARRSAWLNG